MSRSRRSPRSKASTRSSPPSCRAAPPRRSSGARKPPARSAAALGVEDALAEMPYLTEAMLVTLGKAGIKTLDDLADLATDELIQKKRPEPRRQRESNRPEDKGGILAEYGLSDEQGNEIIMAARAHWFEDEDAAAGRTLLRKPPNETLKRRPRTAAIAGLGRAKRRTCRSASASSRATHGARDDLDPARARPGRRRCCPTSAPRRRAAAPGSASTAPTLEAAQRQGQAQGRARPRVQDAATSSIPDDLGERIEAALRQAALDRLGLEARAGHACSPARDRIEIAARARRGPSAPPRRRCRRGRQPQARPGLAGRRRREGSGRRGLVLPVGASHIVVGAGPRECGTYRHRSTGPPPRVSTHALDRWRAFIGRDAGLGAATAGAPDCAGCGCE